MRGKAFILIAFLFSAVALADPAAKPTAGTARAGSDFAKLGVGIDDVSLMSDGGAKVVWRDLKGPPRAVFFGFTHCPVICPVTVWELDAALAETVSWYRGFLGSR